MNKNLDLTKILKDCPKGFKLYSPICGSCEFDGFNSLYKNLVRVTHKDGSFYAFTKEGYMYDGYDDAECILFPSKDQRDWSKFTAPWYKKKPEPKFKVGDRIRNKETNKDDVYEISKVYDNSYGIVGFNWMIWMKYQDQYELVPNKFNPKTLKPFDKVLVRDDYDDVWCCGHFSHIRNQYKEYKYATTSSFYKCCIPYNDDTKHLVGTNDEAPEYYRYWAD